MFGFDEDVPGVDVGLRPDVVVVVAGRFRVVVVDVGLVDAAGLVGGRLVLPPIMPPPVTPPPSCCATAGTAQVKSKRRVDRQTNRGALEDIEFSPGLLNSDYGIIVRKKTDGNNLLLIRYGREQKASRSRVGSVAGRHV